MSQPRGEESVRLLLFELGGERLGVDAAQVVRIESGKDSSAQLPGLSPLEGGRALVFRDGEGEQFLQVDDVHGMRTVPTSRLRRLPPIVSAPAHTIGVWLDQDCPVLLVDLPTLPHI